MSEGFGTWLVAAHLRDFADRHPGLTVDLVASAGFLSASKREADLAVVLARPPRGPMVAGKLTDYSLCLYASRDYLARRGEPTRATLASDHHLVGYVPDLLYSPELRYLGEIDPALTPTLRSSSIAAQAWLIASGAGTDVLPFLIGDPDPELVRVLPDLTVSRTFWLVTHQDTRHLRRVSTFSHWRRELVGRERKRLVIE